MNASPLHLHQFSLRYPTATVLDRLDLAMKPGVVHALLGPEGAGKSSLLRYLAGRAFGAASSGSALLGDIPVGPGNHATLFDPRAEAGPIAARLLYLVHVATHRPRLLAVDEPTAGLDEAASRAMIDALRELSEQIPVLVATRSAETASAFRGTTSILARGRVVNRSPLAPPEGVAEDGPVSPEPIGPDTRPTRKVRLSEVAEAEALPRTVRRPVAFSRLPTARSAPRPSATDDDRPTPICAFPAFAPGDDSVDELAVTREVDAAYPPVAAEEAQEAPRTDPRPSPQVFAPKLRPIWVYEHAMGPGVARFGGCRRPGLLGDVALELRSLRDSGVDVLISLESEHRLAASDLAAAGIVHREAGFADMRAPAAHDMIDLCIELDRLVAAGTSVCVHCRAGLGRTGTVLAGYLIWRGQTAPGALQAIRTKQQKFVSTDAQERFLTAFAIALRDESIP